MLLLLLACPEPTADADGNDPSDTGDTAVDSDPPPGESGGDSEPGPDPSAVCTTLGLTERPWVDAENDPSLYAVAADVVIPTRAGDWAFSEQYSGCEVYLFIQEEPRQADGFEKALWDRDQRDLVELLPANTHVFFMSGRNSEGNRDEALDDMEGRVENVLEDLEEGAAADLRARIHYVTERDTALEGWLGENMSDPAWGVGVDRFQRIRYIGSYADPTRYDADVGWFAPNLGMAANEAIYYNFESDRDDAMEAEGATVVTVFDGQQGGDTRIDVEMPTGDFDSLSVDLTMACIGDGEYGTCPAWDYMAYLYLCDLPASEANPWASTPCEAGDTQEGECTSPLGDARTGTYSCNEDGLGYADISCSSCDTEIARWITTYHREGRWVYDIRPMLPLLQRGGTRRFRFQSDNSYDLAASLRFSNQGLDAAPTEVLHVLVGENTDTFEVPADATKIELATVISQHGQTCGEFCDAEHHFMVNGDAANEVVVSFPESSTTLGCMEQVVDGTVPNQYGTWWYGRSGWCPGKDVPTQTHDITAQVVLGENTLEYWTVGDAGDVRRQTWVLISR